LEDIFTNSNPKASLQSVETALRTFDIFCKVKDVSGIGKPMLTLGFSFLLTILKI
jgi:hypothetical protein